MGMVKPNVVALTSVLGCCSEKLDLLTGKQVHCVAVRRGFTFETQLCNVLLDMYAKCGKISLARSVFDGICRKDVISWTCMIDAYGRNGCGHEAVGLFQKMTEDSSEVLPNSVTFLSVLSACNHSGLVEEGKKCFNMLKEKYGIDPEPEHYACFIDILGRAGKIEKVWSTYQNMIEQDTRLTAGVWIALLNACSLSQDFERGEFAAKHLLQLEPDKASNIVLVSNFYAASGRWDCADELRSIMRTKGLVKEEGNSWIGEGINGHATSLSA
jgi:pentatricopeptide repeat protein